ncbi:MAG: tetratricopeptide repeat protein [SAR324 cluster bacterium]|nr:tetratricopeptide repeat protein [SAR324 cluster bacterium]
MSAELVRLKKLSILADELTSSGKIEASRNKIIDGLELAIEIEEQPYFYFFQGELNYLDEHLLAAVEYYRVASELEPRSPFILRGLGVAYSKQNCVRKAIAIFDRASKMNPYDHRLWRQKGVTLSKMKEFDKALKCFDRAIKLDANDYHSYRQRGVTLINAGQYEEAIYMFSKTLLLNPNDFRALYEKGKALNYAGHGAEALRAHSLSVEIEKRVTHVPSRESLLARIKMNRIRKNQIRILGEFRSAIQEESIPLFKKRSTHLAK